jgi:hypothetical protein
MDSGRNFKITRAILVMTAILMSVVLGSLGVSHNQNPSTENEPETVAQLSKQPASPRGNQSGKQQQEGISASLAAVQPRAEKLAANTTVHKSGTLTQDETWTSDSTYVADEPVVVPEGRTLTITRGAVVKNTEAGAIVVESGGTLNILGTNDAPVVITSSKDDTLGGDTNTDGAFSGRPGDYGNAVHAKAGSKVDIHSAHVSFASTAFVLESSVNITDTKVSVSQTAFRITGGEAKLSNVTIDSANVGLVVSAGVVAFEGSMTNVAGKNIQACNWGIEGCSVDVTYSNIPAEMLGTVPVCGQVTLASMLGGLPDGPLMAANCEATQPADVLNPAI